MATNWLKKVAPHDAAMHAAFAALCTESDYGRLSRAAFNQKAAQLTGVPAAEVAKGIAAETHINTELVEYARTLRQRGQRLACLSNGTQEWTMQVITDYGLGDIFEEVVLSGDLGMVKPHPEIYLHTLKKLGVPAAEAIFVDDRQSNVISAEACGMRGIVFQDTASFVQELDTTYAPQPSSPGKARP